jgi:hypothetical protein
VEVRASRARQALISTITGKVDAFPAPPELTHPHQDRSLQNPVLEDIIKTKAAKPDVTHVHPVNSSTLQEPRRVLPVQQAHITAILARLPVVNANQESSAMSVPLPVSHVRQDHTAI